MNRFLLFILMSGLAYGFAFTLPAIPPAVSAVKVVLGATAATAGALATDKAMTVLSTDTDSATVEKYKLSIRDDVTGMTTDETVKGIVSRSTALNSLRENYGSSGLGSSASSSQLSKALFPDSPQSQGEAQKHLDSIIGSDWISLPHEEGMDRVSDQKEGSKSYWVAEKNGAVAYADTADAACIAVGGSMRGSFCYESENSLFTLRFGRETVISYPAPTSADCYYNVKQSVATCSPSVVQQGQKTSEAAVDEFGRTAPMSLLSQAVPRSEAQTVPTTITIGDKYVTVNNNVITVSTSAAEARAAEENPAEPSAEELADAPNIDFETIEPQVEFKEYVNFTNECIQFDPITFGKLNFTVDTRLFCETIEGAGTATVIAASLIALAILRK